MLALRAVALAFAQIGRMIGTHRSVDLTFYGELESKIELCE
jgi:hypothetical protein